MGKGRPGGEGVGERAPLAVGVPPLGVGEREAEGAAEPLRDAEGAAEGLTEAEQDATSRMEPGPQHAQEAHGMGCVLPNGQ